MKSLEQVAKAYKQSAGKAIYPGVPYPKYQKTRTSRAFDTGNLLTQFVRQNQVKDIIQKTIDGFSLVLDVSPKGAEYGTYVHYGTRYMDARPFAEIPFTNPDAKLQQALDVAIEENIGDSVLSPFFQQIDKDFKKSGFNIA